MTTELLKEIVAAIEQDAGNGRYAEMSALLEKLVANSVHILILLADVDPVLSKSALKAIRSSIPPDGAVSEKPQNGSSTRGRYTTSAPAAKKG